MTAAAILHERDLTIPLSSGRELRADVYRRPDGAPRPVLLQYTAYNKSNWVSVNGVISPTRAVENDFVVVVVDALGRFASDADGAYRPFLSDGPAAAACIEWAAEQSWCDGSVGMYGASNNGVPQWQAAKANAPSLETIVPHFTASEFDRGWVYRDGAFQLGFNLWWSLANLGPDLARRAREAGRVPEGVEARLAEAVSDPWALFAARPLGEAPPLTDLAPHYREWLEHGPGDDYWSATSLEGRWSEVALPVLHVAGWFNVHLDGNLHNYESMRRHGPVDHRDQQHLLIGPWTQWAPGLLGDTCGPERRFPATLDMEGLQLAWFARHLRGGPPVELPRARVFMMGADRWLDLDDWPPPRAQDRSLFLHSAGSANGRKGDGVLDPTPPGGAEEPDVFLYDPRRPVPTIGGSTYLPVPHANSGSRDQRAVEDREDVLVYSTAPLEAALDIAGPIRIRLHVSSTAPATDFTAKLIDVFPDGRAMLLCDGITRVTCPGGPFEVEIDLVATANRFRVGHRVRAEISSSNYPKYDPHPNVSVPAWRATREDLDPAVQTVFHDRGRPSELVLPVLDPGLPTP